MSFGGIPFNNDPFGGPTFPSTPPAGQGTGEPFNQGTFGGPTAPPAQLPGGPGLGAPFNQGTFGGPTVPAAAAPTEARDDDIYQAIRTALDETDQFDGVHYPSMPEDRGRPASEGAMLIIEPGDGDEELLWDDGSGPADIVRTVNYTITIMVREEDPEVRVRELDRLFCVAANAIGGVSLLDVTIPDLGWIRRGHYQPAVSSEQRMRCTARFAYFIDGFGNHDTDE